MKQKFLHCPSRNRRRFSMRDFVYSHRTLIRRALQVKLPMLQVSVNPCCFTIFTTKENCIFFYGKNVRRLPWRLWKKAAVMSRLICSIP